jgi:NADPH:quinone reductase-like Zn-dependent oxidoreductase
VIRIVRSAVAVATGYGGPEVLEIVEQEVAEPGPGEAVLEVRAAGVNPVDWKMYSGARGRDPSALPMRLGMEGSGVLIAVGLDAVGPAGPLAIGDEVVAYRIAGAYAERVVVPATAVVPKPREVSFELAGGLMLAGVTAIHALTAVGAKPGETLLVHAASGAVGRIAVQVARARGINVIGTAAPARHDELRALGAEPVAYGDGLLERVRGVAGNGVDAAIDAAGTDEALDTSLGLVADRARVATVANIARGLREGIRVLGGAPGADPGGEIRQAARLELSALAAQGTVTLDVTPYPLAEAAAAHRESMTGHPRGKLVLAT